MVESPQRIYIHDSHNIQDDGEELFEVSINTRDTTPPNAREKIYEEIYNLGVDPALLHNELNEDIGTVYFNSDDTVDKVELADWVIEEYQP